jgi:hypothetical protein
MSSAITGRGSAAGTAHAAQQKGKYKQQPQSASSQPIENYFRHGMGHVSLYESSRTYVAASSTHHAHSPSMTIQHRPVGNKPYAITSDGLKDADHLLRRSRISISFLHSSLCLVTHSFTRAIAFPRSNQGVGVGRVGVPWSAHATTHSRRRVASSSHKDLLPTGVLYMQNVNAVAKQGMD